MGVAARRARAATRGLGRPGRRTLSTRKACLCPPPPRLQFTEDSEGWAPPLRLKAVNHVAIGCDDVDAIERCLPAGRQVARCPPHLSPVQWRAQTIRSAPLTCPQRRFYTKVLGFRRIPRPDLGFEGKLCMPLSLAGRLAAASHAAAAPLPHTCALRVLVEGAGHDAACHPARSHSAAAPHRLEGGRVLAGHGERLPCSPALPAALCLTCLICPCFHPQQEMYTCAPEAWFPRRGSHLAFEVSPAAGWEWGPAPACC